MFILAGRPNAQRRPYRTLAGLPLRQSKLAGWVLLLDSLHLPVLKNELHRDIGESRMAEHQALEVNQRHRRLPRRYPGHLSARSDGHLHFDATWCFVATRQFRKELGVDAIRLACKYGLAFIERHHSLVDVALRVGAEDDRPLPILLVIGSIEAVVVEMHHRHLDLVKT